MKGVRKYWWMGLLVAAGVWVSVWDYKNWRHEELKNYGHGPGIVGPKELAKLYQNRVAGVRVRYPAGWTVKVNPRFEVRDKGGANQMKLMVGERAEVARLGEVVISVEKIGKNFPDVVNDEVAKLPAKLAREREHVVTMSADWVVLTWEEGDRVRQRVLGSKAGKMIVVDVSEKKSAWKEWERTYWEMYKSLVII